MAAIKNLNPKAEIAKSHQALAINIGAARGLRDVMKTNLGKYRVFVEIQFFENMAKLFPQFIFLNWGITIRIPIDFPLNSLPQIP